MASTSAMRKGYTRHCIVNRLKQRVDDTFAMPALDGALSRHHAANPRGELEGVVRELFVRTEESREGATILERSAGHHLDSMYDSRRDASAD